MKPSNTFWPTYLTQIKHVKRILIFVGLIAVLIGAAWLWSTQPIRWNEEVALTDGTVIVVKRTAKTAPFGELGGPGGWENKGMTLEILSPKELPKPPHWDFPYVPAIFDWDSQAREWFVVSTFYSCQTWYDLGRPQMPYIEHRVRNGQWQQVELNRNLIGRAVNMETGPRSGGEPSLLTIQEKNERIKDPRIAPKYKHIIDNWKTFC